MEKFEDFIYSLETMEKENLRKGYMKYLKRWPWFAVFCFAGLAVSLLAYKTTPPTYKLESRLLIYGENNSLSSEVTFDDHPYYEKGNIDDQVGILHSYSIFRKTVENLGWQITWYQNNLLSKKELYKNDPFEVIPLEGAENYKNILLYITALNSEEYIISADTEIKINGKKEKIKFEQKCKFNSPFEHPFFHFTVKYINGKPGEKYSFKFNQPSQIALTYLKKVKIDIKNEKSNLVYLKSEGEIPQKEADFLNELNKVFIQFKMEKKSQSSKKSVDFIEAQSKEVKKSLQAAEERVNNYRKHNKAMNVSQEANLIYEKLADIENEQFLASQRLSFYKNLQDNLDDSQMIGQLGNPSAVGINDDGLNTLLNKLIELYNKREILSLTVQKKSPNYIHLEKEIELTVNSLKKSLHNLIRDAERDTQSINNRFNTIQARLAKLPETEKRLVDIQRDFEVKNELYNFLIKKKAEASILQASIAPQAKVIDPALVETAVRVGPVLIFYLFGGIVLGFLIPFIFITVIGFFDNSIASLEEIEKESKIPVLDGIIHHKYKVKLPVIEHPRSGIAESFRGLKVNLQEVLNQPGSKVISINSLLPKEGKSFISTNFAAILAMYNKKVLLVGADLHKPSIHLFIGEKSDTGLSSFLDNQTSFEEIIQPTQVTNLSLIQAGASRSNPSGLFDNGRLEEFFNRARAAFDYIVLDNAPVLLIPNAIVINQFADVNLFILRLNQSHKDQIKQINKIVEFNKIKQASILVNDVPHKGYGYAHKYWKQGYGDVGSDNK
ncbi:MAG: polysaccharide biosynthesis tyrosine autokinase [Chlorobi bacterium]|nr:polysaccharide biosynthesis tyrosine autokinase [Chlorobiota bacterium]